MNKPIVVAASAIALLVAGGSAYLFLGDEIAEKISGPEDYTHFSSYFTMNESTAVEMNMDGGTAMIQPGDDEARILAGNQVAPAEGSPALTFQD